MSAVLDPGFCDLWLFNLQALEINPLKQALATFQMLGVLVGAPELLQRRGPKAIVCLSLAFVVSCGLSGPHTLSPCGREALSLPSVLCYSLRPPVSVNSGYLSTEGDGEIQPGCVVAPRTGPPMEGGRGSRWTPVCLLSGVRTGHMVLLFP